MINPPKKILLTNDDGIYSPGIWAAAKALSAIGVVTVAAPREQYSGAGRSLPNDSDGIIMPQEMDVDGQVWTAYAIGGSPAQSVLHGVLEILGTRPDLVVSGINFGENVGTGISVSGTVGAALEAASLGIPALAISQETQIEDHYSLSKNVNFDAAAHFAKLFAKKLLVQKMPFDVDLLKIDLPISATISTPWEITSISRARLFEPIVDHQRDWSQPGKIGYQYAPSWQQAVPGSDVHAIKMKQVVSVTPISLDMTSRISAATLERILAA